MSAVASGPYLKKSLCVRGGLTATHKKKVWNRHFPRALTNRRLTVLEVTGSAPGVLGPERLFFHVSKAIGEEVAMWCLRYVGPAPAGRIYLETRLAEDGSPEMTDRWRLVFRLMDSFEDRPQLCHARTPVLL